MLKKNKKKKKNKNKRKIKEKNKLIIFYNPLFNSNSIFYDDLLYKRINKMMDKWEISLINTIELIINIDLVQDDYKDDIQKCIHFIKYLNYICKIIIEDSIIDKYNVSFYDKSKISFLDQEIKIKLNYFQCNLLLILRQHPKLNQYLYLL